MHPATEATLKHFEYKHLPVELQAVSKDFYYLAHNLANNSKLEGAQLTICLQKLLEAKDCAVRAALK